MAELNNVRHEKFAQGVANGLSQRKAYRAAFPKSENWKDETVDKRASELKKNGAVLGRIQELGKQASSKAIMNATQRKEWLTAKILDDNEKTENQLKAIDILNKMDSSYIEKVEMSGQLNNPFAGLSTEELKRLAEE